MKKKLLFIKILSISLVTIIFTDSIGYALEMNFANQEPNCSEWNIEPSIIKDDKRILIGPVKQTDQNNCNAVFTLNNGTSLKIGDLYKRGGYTMELSKFGNNSTVIFGKYNDPFLAPGVEIDIEAFPNDLFSQADVTLQGSVTGRSVLYYDLPIFILKSVFELADVKCFIPDNQVVLLANRTSPILANTAELALAGKVYESKQEFSRVYNIFFDKVAETSIELSIECLTDFVLNQIVGNKVIAAKMLVEFLYWPATVFIDYMRYEAAPASISLSYTPKVAVVPTEKWIAFINQDNLWLIHPDGSDLTPVTTNGGQTWGAVAKWSPDGKTLAYTQNLSDNISIMLYDVQTSMSTTLITGVGSGFDWSLNGKQIIYENKGLWVINFDNGNKRNVIRAPQNDIFGSVVNPQWSPDGSYVIFSGYSVDAIEYDVVDFNTGKPTVILPLNRSNYGCVWAPSDLMIACTTETDTSPSEPVVRFLDVNGNVLQELRLPENMVFPTAYWSPDGEKLAISYYEKGMVNVLLDILSLDTKDIQPLARGYVSDWSSDGQWILSWEGYSIYLTNTTSGDTVELTEGIYPIWQP